MSRSVRAEHRWLELQHRSIAITGKLIEDLNAGEIVRFVDALTEAERASLFDRLLRVSRHLAGAPAVSDAAVRVTQERVRASMTSKEAERELRRALAGGATVEPGPLNAYLRRDRTQRSASARRVVIAVRPKNRSPRHGKKPS